MTKTTQKQLIEELKALKDIKPRQEWVILAKSQIFNNAEDRGVIVNPARKASIFDVIASINIQRRLAYSFASLVFIFVGLVGFAQYTMPGDLLFPVRKITERSEAALAGQTELRQNAATLNNRINDLAKAAKDGKKDNIPATISEINTKASELVKDIKQKTVEDPETLKEIAASLKVLADVTSADQDLENTADVKDLYQAVVESQIADFKTATLTDEQAIILLEAEALYEKGENVEALEKILEITN